MLNSIHGKNADINSVYLDGISITHVMPRKHISSYAAGLATDRVDEHSCHSNGGPDNVPTLVRRNWYCESGNSTDRVLYEFFPNYFLWGGMNCT